MNVILILCFLLVFALVICATMIVLGVRVQKLENFRDAMITSAVMIAALISAALTILVKSGLRF